MLSFLRDQSLEDLPVQKKTNTPAGKAPGDGTEKSQESEYLTVASQGKRVRKSTTLLAVISNNRCSGTMPFRRHDIKTTFYF